MQVVRHMRDSLSRGLLLSPEKLHLLARSMSRDMRRMLPRVFPGKPFLEPHHQNRPTEPLSLSPYMLPSPFGSLGALALKK